MSKQIIRQHVVIDEDYHKAISILAAEEGCSNADIVQDILGKNNTFRKKLDKVRRK